MTARVLEIVSLFLERSVEEPFDMEDREEFVETLVAQGHNPDEVYAALNIVENIQERMDAPILSSQRLRSNRVFLLLENFQLSPEVRGRLDQLVQMGVLSPIQRADIVERAFMMDPEEVNLEQIEYMVDDLLMDEPRNSGYFDETISDYYH